MIKRTLLAAAIFSALPAYAGLTSITAGYDFTDYSGDHGNRNLAYAELVAKVENATLLFNLSQGRRDYETEHYPVQKRPLRRPCQCLMPAFSRPVTDRS